MAQKNYQPDLEWAFMDPAIDCELLDRLALEVEESFLERIAHHSNASEKLLRKLSLHPNSEIRGAVTENPSVPPALILLLSSDDNPDVRFRIAENARSPINVLELLTQDENPYVAHRATRTLDRIQSKTFAAGSGLLVSIHDTPEDRDQNKESLEEEMRQIVPFTLMTNRRTESQKQTPTRAKNLRILVIEDNPADTKLLQKSLAKWTFELNCVDRLSKGLELLAREPIDVVLLDLSLPDAQGIETFYLVHCQVPQIPVVVLTGLEDESIGNEAVQLGAQDYLVKGQVTPNLLARAIKYAVERHESEIKIRELNESLERRILQLAAANQDLERLTQAMSTSSAQARDLLDRLAQVMDKEKTQQTPAQAFETAMAEQVGRAATPARELVEVRKKRSKS
jgi:DNA-binding response OmpR family regulator